MDESAFSFQVRANRHVSFKYSVLRKSLDRARRALRLEAAKLKNEREKIKEIMQLAEEMRMSLKGTSPNTAHFKMILLCEKIRRIVNG